MRFTRHRDGEWIQPLRRGYRLACCDCGLVHRIDLRIVRGRIQYRATRAPRSTAMMRRHRATRRCR